MSALDTYIARNDARMDRLEALLTVLAGGTPATEAKAKTAPVAPVVVAGTHPAGHCQGCGKAGMISNPLCKACRSGKAPAKTTKAVAAQVTAAAPAKRGRDASAQCVTDRCSLFVKTGSAHCTKHAGGEEFLTLEDGKRGYRVPAALGLPLRKAGLTDEQIVAAAKAKGVGHKVPKAKGSLV